MNTEKEYAGDGDTIGFLRQSLAEVPSPQLRLILLEHALIFDNLPDDLAELHSKLKGELDPFPIPPVTGAMEWIEKMRKGGRRNGSAAEPYETGDVWIEVDGGGFVGGGWTASYLIEVGDEKIAGTLATGDGDSYCLPEKPRGSRRIWREVFEYFCGLEEEYQIPSGVFVSVELDVPGSSSAISYAMTRREERGSEEDLDDLRSLGDDELLRVFLSGQGFEAVANELERMRQLGEAGEPEVSNENKPTDESDER